MLNLTLRYLLIVFCGLYFSMANAETFSGQVVGVSDGDTLTVLDTFRQQHKIRLIGIDAPESKQAFGTASKQHLSRLVFGKNVTVEWFKRDRYKRILGRVLLDGHDVNLEQIRAGYAWHFTRYQADQMPMDRQFYAKAQEAGRTAGVGLWRDPAPIPPWDFRRKR